MKMSVHKYNIQLSEKNAHFMNDVQREIKLTKYNSFFYNVPPGLNYYSLQSNNNLLHNMYVKVESYIDDNK